MEIYYSEDEGIDCNRLAKWRRGTYSRSRICDIPRSWQKVHCKLKITWVRHGGLGGTKLDLALK